MASIRERVALQPDAHRVMTDPILSVWIKRAFVKPRAVPLVLQISTRDGRVAELEDSGTSGYLKISLS